MKVVIDVRKLKQKGQKHHEAFCEFVYNRAVKNQNAEVELRTKNGFELVAMNGVIGREV